MTASLNSVPKAEFLNLLTCLGSPRLPLVHYRDPENSVYSYSHGYELLLQKPTKQNQQVKGSQGEVWRKPDTSFQDLSPSRVTQDTLHFSASNCNSACKVLSTGEAC